MRKTASIVSDPKGLPPKDCIPNLKKTFSLYKYNGERRGPSNTTNLIELDPISIMPPPAAFGMMIQNKIFGYRSFRQEIVV